MIFLHRKILLWALIGLSNYSCTTRNFSAGEESSAQGQVGSDSCVKSKEPRTLDFSPPVLFAKCKAGGKEVQVHVIGSEGNAYGFKVGGQDAVVWLEPSKLDGLIQSGKLLWGSAELRQYKGSETNYCLGRVMFSMSNSTEEAGQVMPFTFNFELKQTNNSFKRLWTANDCKFENVSLFVNALSQTN